MTGQKYNGLPYYIGQTIIKADKLMNNREEHRRRLQYLGVVLKKLNLTQQKQTTTQEQNSLR